MSVCELLSDLLSTSVRFAYEASVRGKGFLVVFHAYLVDGLIDGLA